MDLVGISRRLTRELEKVRFGPPTSHVYNPLVYARASHERYLERFGGRPGRVVLVGMNPGPFGMAQTGVPFGDVTMVREFLGIEAPVGKPAREHPARPVAGFACSRGEVSGTRLWGWARDRFGDADGFFSRFFVANYCPLAFMEESGRNRTPDKLSAGERTRLFAACDQALRELVAVLRPTHVIGIGSFAEARALASIGNASVRIGGILHPSPASPAANRDWAVKAERQLAGLGIDLSRNSRI
jgi:single-strand selective monofunctional uracil DNA glycosylase